MCGLAALQKVRVVGCERPLPATEPHQLGDASGSDNPEKLVARSI